VCLREISEKAVKVRDSSVARVSLVLANQSNYLGVGLEITLIARVDSSFLGVKPKKKVDE
jgi:hypothetical protein